jgi:FkbM family methyltransferase
MFTFGNNQQFINYEFENDTWCLNSDVPATTVFNDDFYCKSLFTPLFLKGKTVLDLGSNIGFISKRFMEFGCKKVVAYEADPITFEVCKKNLEYFSKKYNTEFEIYNYAVSDTKKQMPFYISKKNHIANSLIKGANRSEILVNTISFKDVIEKSKPDIIKCNIEAGEYFFNWNDINDECQILAIELHKDLIKDNPKEYDRLRNWIFKNFYCYFYKKVNLFQRHIHDIYVGIRKNQENQNFIRYVNILTK